MDAQIIAMIQILLMVTTTSVFALVLSLFSYFLDFCFWRGNIFSFWLPFVAKNATRLLEPIKYKHIINISDKEKRDDTFIEIASSNELFKLLGGCSICLNVWLGFITFPITVSLLKDLININYWYFPVYLFVSSFFLRKIMKID